MLEVTRFDIKTGKPIQESIEGSRQPVVKQVENSYLEHWLKTNNIEAQFSVAKFYTSVNDTDRQRLESEGKVLAFSSGSDGYFTDAKTAQLMTIGDEAVTPIYAGDRESAHNVVAYGSLIASDGVASTVLPASRILVIDDENRSAGDAVLPISEQQLSALYDKMGDGTMLVSAQTMQALQTDKEQETLVLKASDTAIATAERQTADIAQRRVVQFRAAIAGLPDVAKGLPGIAKGTVASSDFCERLGVAAIISTNDIKGADDRFSKPGLKEVSEFWINRKATAEYGYQSVGPQVKYTIPEATIAEINPAVQAQAEELSQVAGDFAALSQRYIEQHEKEQSLPYQDLEEDENTQDRRPDGLYEVLKADKYGQLTGQSNAVRSLNRYVQSEWKRLALNGTSVSSAMAQHHSQLKPWEVCNKSLPHGAIVAYYRSPFPNVGAAALAVNNRKIIQSLDSEAFDKQGVAYLPPWTAKNVAITDFDGDMNGFFVGYQATVADLPEQIRAELATVPASENQQYEAGRALFARMIQQYEQGQENRIAPAESPLAVKEFVERNAPDVKPPEITKQKKDKHTWAENESHSAATWRAWEITADNPTGRVANAGMTLQALSLELKYAPEEKQDALLRQVSTHFSKVLSQADAGKVSIPDDDWLSDQGFSPFYREKMENIAGATTSINTVPDDAEKRQVTTEFLKEASDFLSEVANGPNAVNLQTAVDTAKSSRGIDEDLHGFVMALQYKSDELRQAKKDTSAYIDGAPMPTSTDEPIAEGVQLVNEQYSNVQLPERKNDAYDTLLPKADSKTRTVEMRGIALTHNKLVKDAAENRARVRQRRSADQKPTLLVTIPGGQRLELQNIEDKRGTLPIWRSPDGQPLAGTIRIKRDNSATARKQFPAQLVFVDSAGKTQAQRIGYVSPATAKDSQPLQQLKSNEKLPLNNPAVTAQVPWAQQHDTEMLYEVAAQYLERSLAPPNGIDPETHHRLTAAALWQAAGKQGQKGIGNPGRNVVIKAYPDVFGEHLSRAPETTIGRLQVTPAMRQQLIEQNPHTIQFGTGKFESTTTNNGEKSTSVVELPTVQIVQPYGDHLVVGAISGRKLALPEGATYMAHLSPNESSQKVIDMQILDLPAVEQTKPQLDALAQGRTHMTFEGEPYAVYGVKAGDVVVAQDADSDRKIAVQVGQQYRITAKTLETDGYLDAWSKKEQVPATQLERKLATVASQPPVVWGLTVEPLGEYKTGQIQPFPEVEQTPQQTSALTQDTGTAEKTVAVAAPELEPQSTAISGKPMTVPEPLHQEFTYAPSYGEVEAWLQAKWQSDGSAGELEEIGAEIGAIEEKLRYSYLITVDGPSFPDPDYKDPSITISGEQYEEMQALGIRLNRDSVKQAAVVVSEPEPQSVTISGKPMIVLEPLHISREQNPLPVDSCLEAMRGYGRLHSTHVGEPYKRFEFEAGQNAIAQDLQGTQVAFVVGKQYQITADRVSDKTFRQFWAAVEKQSPEKLDDMLQTSKVTGQPLWGLKMMPTGDYGKGKVVAFPSAQNQLYRPTHNELRQWYGVTGKDELLHRRVAAAGLMSAAIYRIESGDLKGRPPGNYQSDHVVISASDKAKIERAIAATKTQASVRQVSKQHSAEGR